MKQTEKSKNRIRVIRFQQPKKSYITGIKKSPRRRMMSWRLKLDQYSIFFNYQS